MGDALCAMSLMKALPNARCVVGGDRVGEIALNEMRWLLHRGSSRRAEPSHSRRESVAVGVRGQRGTLPTSASVILMPRISRRWPSNRPRSPSVMTVGRDVAQQPAAGVQPAVSADHVLAQECLMRRMSYRSGSGRRTASRYWCIGGGRPPYQILSGPARLVARVTTMKLAWPPTT